MEIECCFLYSYCGFIFDLIVLIEMNYFGLVFMSGFDVV